LERFAPERLMLTSECGFGHVPLDITRAKLRSLSAGAASLRQRFAPAV
jgi:5-methyltetrahydropteroyltriglutamate--homocysteine methyltransferase